jgi:hypothetical protein
VVWIRHLGPVIPYCGIGLMAGFRTVTRESGRPLAAFGLSPGPLPSWGYGVAANLGGSIDLGAGTEIFLELTAAAQNDLYTGDTHGMLLPAAGLAWRF